MTAAAAPLPMGEVEAIGILQEKKGHYATISGTTYHVMDHVSPFVEKTPINTEVSFRYRPNKQGGRSLVRLSRKNGDFKNGNQVKQGIASGSSSTPNDGLTEFQRAEKAMAEKEGRTYNPPAAATPPATGPVPTEKETIEGPADRERLIVLQSVLKVCASVYQTKPTQADTFEQACDRVWTKTIDLTEKLFQEARK